MHHIPLEKEYQQMFLKTPGDDAVWAGGSWHRWRPLSGQGGRARFETPSFSGEFSPAHPERWSQCGGQAESRKTLLTRRPPLLRPSEGIQDPEGPPLDRVPGEAGLSFSRRAHPS